MGHMPNIMSEKLFGALFSVLATLTMSIVPAGALAADPVKFTVSQIIAGMNRFAARFNDGSRWVLRYSQRLDGRNTLPDEYSGVYPDEEIINACKGDWWYVYEKQERPFKRQEPDAMVQGWSCWKNGISVERIANNVWILPEPSVHSRQLFWYTHDLFLNAPTPSKPRSPLRRVFGSGSNSQEDSRWLPEAVEEHGAKFKVRPLLEDVDGASCHVLEWPDHDIIWVDCNRGFVVCRRVYYQSPQSPLLEVEHSGLREVKPGVWLPSKEVTAIYNHDTDSSPFAGKVKLVRTNTLIECRFENVPDSLFDVPRIRQGKVTDYVRGITYVKYPPDSDPFEEAVRRAPIEMSNPAVSLPAWLEMGLLLAIGCNCILLLVQLSSLLSRHRSGARLVPPPLLTKEHG
jgi:hypothetical protein